MIHTSTENPLFRYFSFACLKQISAIAISLFLLLSVVAQEQKLKPEDIVAKHLESIGTPEARAVIKSRVVTGTIKASRIVGYGAAGSLSGQAMMASAGAKLRFGMKFPDIQYPGEDMAFDGSRAETGILPQGGRSHISVFLQQQDLPLKEGLVGGILSTAWPLLRMEQSQPRLEYRGLKKIEEKELYELSYQRRKGSNELKVLLYFEPVTFRHVRTLYDFKTATVRGTEGYHKLMETFDDFRVVDGLTLPHKYKLKISVEGDTITQIDEYALEVRQLSHKQTFDDQVFKLK